MKIYIYGLHSGDNIIRYVGKTINPKNRMYSHLKDFRGKCKHKVNWVNKCKREGLNISMYILEECDDLNWCDREKFWISQFRSLTNISEGGGGCSGKYYKIEYEEFKLWVNKNLPFINSYAEWRDCVNKLPKFIPKRPDVVYKNNGWISYRSLLNNNRFIPFKELCVFVAANNIKSKREYILLKGNNMPSNPEIFYKEWSSWYDFLNKKKSCKSKKTNKQKIILKIDEAKEIIKGYYLTTKSEYTKWYLLNKDKKLPRSPNIYYRKEWISWSDFFGNGFKKKILYKGGIKNKYFYNYYDPKKWVNQNFPNIKSEFDWRKIKKELPKFIPKRPDFVYKKNEWISYREYLSNRTD